MKKLFFLIIGSFFLCSSAYSAQKAENITEAKQQAQNEGADYIALVYGEGWDVLGKQFQEQVWSKSALFAKLEPSTILCEVTLLENPTEEEAKAEKEKNKDFKEGIKSLPQIFFFDKTGFCYATLFGSELRAGPEKLSTRLQQIQTLRKRRDDLVSRSEKAQGKNKARYLGQAAEIPGLNRPKQYLEEIRKCDPEDTSGYIKRLTFNIYDYHKYLKTPFDEAVRELDALVADPAYTNEQKQLILGLKSTIQRKNKVPESELRKTFRKMQSLDPNSLMGKAAGNAMKAYVK